ncbi:LLM class flavin-dependent oxidoreductase [Catenulispora pinisilvae]|uniref:LLM class flavin-dependent oxidoreductase n=1 Tax=Catenulispora pinisilvae TaxID=2705253 RepID=UPI001890E38C|nr:LLM class flavin-dependent oxidoreductase [Catenulispora pinisilvae]
MSSLRVGVMYDRAWAPEGLPAFAREVEALGADELWVVEDLSWGGGISAATVALAATSRMRVGLGIAPAPLRNPALLAMEVALLARVYPGRFVAGIGHGVTGWMASVGAAPASALALLAETTEAVRALLRGEQVQMQGSEVRIDDLRLVHPPAQVPPVVLGVVRPRSLELSGRVADGTVLAEGHGPADLESALALIRKGGGAQEHELIVFTYAAVADDPRQATEVLRPAVEDQAAWLDRAPAEVFTVSGTPADAAARIAQLEAAGATSVVLRFSGEGPVRQLGATLAAFADR